MNSEESLPLDYVMDLAGRCNLRCRYCPEGRRINHQPRDRMTLADFASYAADILPQARSIGLTNWSEPFLNPEIFDIIAHGRRVNPDTIFTASTNGQVFTAELARRCVASGLDHLVVSLSGIRQDIYEIYHAGGRLARVLDALGHLTEAKLDGESKRPTLEVVYLMFPFNYITLGALRRHLRRHLGSERFGQIDLIRLNYGYLSGSDLTPERLRAGYGPGLDLSPRALDPQRGPQPPCLAPAIRADGTVFPCCAVTYDPSLALGNLAQDTFGDIWRQPAFRDFRAGRRAGTNPVCARCRWHFPRHAWQWNRHWPHSLRARFWLWRQMRRRGAE